MYYIFSEMEKSIYNEEDKVLFNEVIICYNNGAYRSAYIINWICIAESLKSKLKYLSLRNPELMKFLKKIESEENKSSVDQDLITKSAKEGIIDKIEEMKLLNIQKLRNKYAHPSNVNPHADEVISAIRIGVEAVLSKAPLLGESFIRTLVNSMKGDYHFLDDNRDKIILFTHELMSKIQKEVILYTIKNVANELEKIYSDHLIEHIFRRRLFIFLETFIKESEIDLKDEIWQIDIILVECPNSFCEVLISEDLFVKCNEFTKDRIIGLSLEPMKNNKIEKPSLYSLGQVWKLKRLNLLGNLQIERLKKVINLSSYMDLRFSQIPLFEYFNKIIQDLKIHDWYTQKSAVGALLEVIDQWNGLEYSAQVELGRNILQAAEGGCKKAGEFFYDIYEYTFDGDEGIVEGVLLETVINERGEFRFKGLNFLDKILNMLIKLKHEKLIDIVERFIKEINNYKRIIDYKVTNKQLSEYKQNMCDKLNLTDNEIFKKLLVDICKAFDDKLEQYNNMISEE